MSIIPTLQEPTLAGRSAAPTAFPSLQRPALSVRLAPIAAWIIHRRERRTLRELAEDKRLLTDIGLTREQVLGEAAKPFWRR